MPLGSTGKRFNGGTITNPLVIDLSADIADRTALDVIQPVTFGFSVRPFRFRQTDVNYFQMETTGILSTSGNDLSTAGGSLTARGGNMNVVKSDGTPEHVLGSDPLAGFFGANPVAQQALTPGTATPEQIATALQAYGLSHA